MPAQSAGRPCERLDDHGSDPTRNRQPMISKRGPALSGGLGSAVSLSFWQHAVWIDPGRGPDRRGIEAGPPTHRPLTVITIMSFMVMG